jgi:hypothetical protein
MEREDVNELILDKVDQIEDKEVRRFIGDILRYERSELDKEKPHYKSTYNDLIDEYVGEWETPEMSD